MMFEWKLLFVAMIGIIGLLIGDWCLTPYLDPRINPNVNIKDEAYRLGGGEIMDLRVFIGNYLIFSCAFLFIVCFGALALRFNKKLEKNYDIKHTNLICECIRAYRAWRIYVHKKKCDE